MLQLGMRLYQEPALQLQMNCTDCGQPFVLYRNIRRPVEFDPAIGEYRLIGRETENATGEECGS